MPHTSTISVTVRASARLHMGFLDLNGGLGRRFGSLGLSLDELATTLTAYPAEQVSAEGPQSERVESFARQSLAAMGITDGTYVQIHQAIPDHAGLGSGTQLALAVGTALARLYGVDWPVPDMARKLNRGARSGIGLGLFTQGGFVVDGGRKDEGDPPLVISRIEFPAQWRVILVMDKTYKGLHGEQEKQAFAALPKFPEARAAHLCRLALMQAMPSLVEQDLPGFGAAIHAIQQTVGDHFAPAQGGRFASHHVASALAWLARNGAEGIGQSSWGPTGFALTDSEIQARSLARAAYNEFGTEGLEFMVCSGRNRGAEIRTEAYRAQAHS
ncbi:MAG: beta-ribofuranosylaminobenzene 5'-phosphate synthase family protein [Pseudomonadota bacterium]